MRRSWHHLAAFALGTVLSACASFAPEIGHGERTSFATHAGWIERHLLTDRFVLASYVPETLTVAETLHIYIEGDGFAWINRSTPSPDPTPKAPLALRLALRDPSHRAVYLARPCQFVFSLECSTPIWTNRRYAPEVIQATDQAIDQLMRSYHAKNLVLIGYSGGGTVAALVAAQRNDINLLVTVAGNLDTEIWTHMHRLSPLTGSLNPADRWPELSGLRQIHFLGGRDATVPAQVVESYRKRLAAYATPTIITLPELDHREGWVKAWPDLLKMAGLLSEPPQ